MSSSPSAAPRPVAASFPERFILTQFGDEGVLLDLLTGELYRLNAAASRICASLARGKSPAEAQRVLAESFGLSRAEAARNVAAVLAQLEDERAADPRSPVTFEAVPDGFLLRWEGKAILRIDRNARILTLVEEPIPPESDLAQYILWAAPHLLILQHQPVLHASAVQHGDGVLALSGPSGAGKSTLARLFGEQGARVISDDLLLLSFDRGCPAALENGEAALQRWVAAKASILAAGKQVEIGTGDLPDVLRGPTLPLREVLHLDPERRSGDAISVDTPAPADALVLLLENSFAELGQRDVWIYLVEISRKILNTVSVGRAFIPDGPESLRAAVQRYRMTSTS